MSRRLLIVEPDAAGRTMMDRVLTAEGFSVEAFGSVHDARAELDAGRFDLAVLDEIGGRRGVLEEVRWVRREHPKLPVVVTGAMLSQRVMRELVRLRVMDVLPKPFTPVELRESVAHAQGAAPADHAEALEYAAAIEAAGSAIASGATAFAVAPLVRAQAISPLDAEITALWALLAELDGRDEEADRGYRAAMALHHEEGASPPDPYEGLARLAAYGGARPVAALAPRRAEEPLLVVTDPAAELGEDGRIVEGPHVVVMALGIAAAGSDVVYFRDGAGPRAFALLPGPLRAEALAAALARLGSGPLAAAKPTRDRLDLQRIEALRADERAGRAREGAAALPAHRG